MKTIQFYSKTYDNLMLMGNLSMLFSSIPKHMRILRWSETYQSYSVVFQNIKESDVDLELMKAIQVDSKGYDSHRMIGKLIKAIEFYSKGYDNVMLIGNWSKLLSSIPKQMKILDWSETYRGYTVLFQNIWEFYIGRKLMKAIQFYSKTYENLMLIGNWSKLFSSIPKHMTILPWSETYQSYSVLF